MSKAFFSAPLHSGMASPWDEGQERNANLAARREFVAMKTIYVRAAADVDAPIGAPLQRKVRLAIETAQLWRLRAATLCSLRPDHVRTPHHRLELHRELDRLVDAPLTAGNRAQ